MLRLEIDGRWEPRDFIETLHAVESFYYKLAHRRRRRFGFPPWFHEDNPYWEREPFGHLSYEATLDRVNQRLLEEARYHPGLSERLDIGAIQYASPGSIDLLGIGKVFETIVNSIGRVRSYYDEAHVRRERDRQAILATTLRGLEVEKEKENLQALKIQNARESLALLETHPEMRDVLIPLLVRDQDALASRVADGKLVSARIISDDRRRR